MRLSKKARILKNNLKALTQYRKEETHLKYLPSYFWIEPTNHCNLNCIMCPNGAGKVHVERGYMALDLFKKIIDEIHPYASLVILALSGESFLHPRLFEMIEYAGNHQVKTALNTNATLIDPAAAENLLDSGVDYISFAFDGYTKEMYERARRGGDFDKTLENILGFLKKRDERGQKKPHTVLSMLRLESDDSNPGEKKKFLEPFNGLIDDIHMREVNSWGRMFSGTKDFHYANFDGLAAPCGRLWNSLAITWNGDVVPCTYNMNHEYLLGNIRNSPLTEIWNSTKQVELRRSMLDGTYLDLSPVCENCTIGGTPKIMGIPAGLRATIADSLINFLGYGFEKSTIKIINIFKKGNFASEHVV